MSRLGPLALDMGEAEDLDGFDGAEDAIDVEGKHDLAERGVRGARVGPPRPDGRPPAAVEMLARDAGGGRGSHAEGSADGNFDIGRSIIRNGVHIHKYHDMCLNGMI